MKQVALALSLMMLAGCRQAPPPPPSGTASAPGWEVRYDAVLALAHRGSDKFLDPVVQDLVREMLDEEQQLRNYRITLKSGQETGNPAAARMAILGTLNSLTDYHAKKPDADLTGLKPAVQKLTKSENRVIAKVASSFLELLAVARTPNN